jgi:hypothetical protein
VTALDAGGQQHGRNQHTKTGYERAASALSLRVSLRQVNVVQGALTATQYLHMRNNNSIGRSEWLGLSE